MPRDPTLLLAVVGGLGYLAGSVPFGLLIARLRGVDIRTQGSGNIGASNVGRVLGLWYGVAVFVVDAAKGAAGAALIPAVAAGGTPPLSSMVAGGVASVVGHCFPVWLRGRGGKGVATAAGVLLCISPIATLVALAVWVGIAATWRVASIASVGAGVCFLASATAIDMLQHRPQTVLRLGCYGLIAGLVALRHRHNISRLAAGEELGLSDGETEENR